MNRLATEIMIGSTGDPQDAEVLPYIVRALLADNPAEEKRALDILQGIVDQRWGDKVIPKLIEAMREKAAQVEQQGKTGTAAGKPKLQPVAGIFSQLDQKKEDLDGRISRSDPQTVNTLSRAEWGKGQAGAGGVSLHKAADLPESIDVGKISGVEFYDNQMSLIYGKKKIKFPRIDPDYLATAFRCIYGGEGIIKGELAADEPTCVVFDTGADRFGEVAWRKEFLAEPWEPVPLGTEIGLPLGPAIGALSLPEPSRDRITYYGPIVNTRLGAVLLESDMLLTQFMSGIEWRTGSSVPPPKVEGFMTSLERFARTPPAKPSDDAEEQKQQADPSGLPDVRRWWEGTIWLVWVTDQVELKLAEDADAMEFATSRVKLAIWSDEKSERLEVFEALGAQVTRDFDKLADHIVVLKQLKEVAKAVSVVRWMKKNDISVDMTWANSYELMHIDTPRTVRSYNVFLLRKRDGEPYVN